MLLLQADNHIIRNATHKKTGYICIEELFVALLGDVFHLLVHLHDAVLMEIRRRIGRKRIANKFACPLFFLLGADVDTTLASVGYLAGGTDDIRQFRRAL